jgi:hypothetical protein
MNRTNVSIFDHDSPVYLERVVDFVRKSGTITAAELSRAFEGYEPELWLACGYLMSADRLAWEKPPLGRTLEDWMGSVLCIGHEEIRRIKLRELDEHSRMHERRECPHAGKFGHWGCGVCPHGELYAACYPCLSARVKAAGAT